VIPWSAKEKEILERYYPVEGRAVAKRLPERSESAIAQRVVMLGITMDQQARKAVSRRPKKESQQANVRAATPPQSYQEAKARGMIGELMGKTPSTKVGLVRVPESALNLPWVSYPTDSASCIAAAEMCEHMSRASYVTDAVAKFFISQAKELRERAKRKIPA
jgi:hypothetical protein